MSRKETMASYTSRSLLVSFTVGDKESEEEADLAAHDTARYLAHENCWGEWELRRAKRFIQQRNGKTVYAWEAWGTFDHAEAMRRLQAPKKQVLTKEEALAALKADQEATK